MTMGERTVRTRWDGGMRAITQAGGFEIVVDEPEVSGGTNTGPQPTDLLLASVSSCFALAMAFAAKKSGIELVGLSVEAVGSYQGPRFARIVVSITSDNPRETLEELLPDAQRVCYVTNTLRHQPELIIGLG
jgi:putative redox protein